MRDDWLQAFAWYQSTGGNGRAILVCDAKEHTSPTLEAQLQNAKSTCWAWLRLKGQKLDDYFTHSFPDLEVPLWPPELVRRAGKDNLIIGNVPDNQCKLKLGGNLIAMGKGSNKRESERAAAFALVVAASAYMLNWTQNQVHE